MSMYYVKVKWYLQFEFARLKESYELKWKHNHVYEI